MREEDSVVESERAAKYFRKLPSRTATSLTKCARCQRSKEDGMAEKGQETAFAAVPKENVSAPAQEMPTTGEPASSDAAPPTEDSEAE